jgi:hypothetical protein
MSGRSENNGVVTRHSYFTEHRLGASGQPAEYIGKSGRAQPQGGNVRRVRAWLRRIKAAVGIGLTWAVGWAAGLFIIAGVAYLVVGYTWAPTMVDLLANVAISGAMGFVAGASFSFVLGLTERHRTFAQLSILRFASWGALGGLALAGVFSLVTIGLTPLDVFKAGVVAALLGSGSAAGSLAIARRAGATDRLNATGAAGLIGER